MKTKHITRREPSRKLTGHSNPFWTVDLSPATAKDTILGVYPDEATARREGEKFSYPWKKEA